MCLVISFLSPFMFLSPWSKSIVRLFELNILSISISISLLIPFLLSLIPICWNTTFLSQSIEMLPYPLRFFQIPLITSLSVIRNHIADHEFLRTHTRCSKIFAKEENFPSYLNFYQYVPWGQRAHLPHRHSISSSSGPCSQKHPHVRRYMIHPLTCITELSTWQVFSKYLFWPGDSLSSKQSNQCFQK